MNSDGRRLYSKGTLRAFRLGVLLAATVCKMKSPLSAYKGTLGPSLLKFAFLYLKEVSH